MSAGERRTARPRDPARRPGSTGRRRRRRPARCPRPRRARAPGGRPGSRARSGWPRGWGRCRRARSTAAPARPGRSRAGRRPPARSGPAIPLPASTTTLSRRPRDRRQREQVVGVRRRARPARLIVPGPVPRAAVVARGATQVADLGEARSPSPIGARAGPAHLDAVVLGRVVARGEHRAGVAEVARGEVELVGATPARSSRRRHRPRPRPRRRPRPCPGELGRMSWPTTTVSAPVTSTKAAPVARASVVVELVGHGAADVVRLEDGVAGWRGRGCRQHGRSLAATAAGCSVAGEDPQVAPARASRGSSTPARPGATAAPAPAAAPPRARRRPARAGRRRTGPCAAGSGASRSTSQPRGAESRSLCCSHRS